MFLTLGVKRKRDISFSFVCFWDFCILNKKLKELSFFGNNKFLWHSFFFWFQLIFTRHRRIVIFIISSQFLIKPYLTVNPDSIYLFKVNKRSTRNRCAKCSESTIKTRTTSLTSFLLFLLLTLNIFYSFLYCFYCWLRTSKC